MIRLTAAAAAFLLAAGPALADPIPEGLWRMESGKAEVRIVDCGGRPCATLASLRKPNDKQGRPKLDRKNPDPALRSRPVVGVSLLSGLTPAPGGWDGDFYNPDDGRTYSGSIRVESADVVKLRGCVAKLFCKTQTLRRVR